MDMNAFFASIEQHDCPELRGRPVAITNGEVGTCIITASYEARAYGVKTGMHLKLARLLCPDLIQCPARPQRYAAVSSRIMSALQQITPDLEIFSVDEAFLDVTRCQRLHGSPPRIAQRTKELVTEVSGLLCSVGVSGDKTTAKYAAKLRKPNGLTVIPPWEAKQRLHNVKVTELCGIAEGIGRFLAARGVYTCGDMARLPIGVLGQRFGNIGRRIWYMCQGQDPEKVHTQVPAPKSIGHGKVTPPNTTDLQLLTTYLLHMSEKVAARLRKHQMKAKNFLVGLRGTDDWIAHKYSAPLPTSDGRTLFEFCHHLLHSHWQGEPIYQVQITALDPSPAHGQLELFLHDTTRQDIRNRCVDLINQRYGEFTVAPARLLQRSTMPNVISPAWKPFGHRQTI
jgi:DNA polymerase-4